MWFWSCSFISNIETGVLERILVTWAGSVWVAAGARSRRVTGGELICSNVRLSERPPELFFYVTFNFICDLFMLPFLILNVIEFVLVRSWFKFFPPGGFLAPSGDVTCSESTCSESSPKMESSESIFFVWTYDGGGGNSKTSDLINRLSSLKIVPTSLSSWSSSSSRRSSWMFELNFHVNRESLRVNPKTVCQTFNLTVPQ